VFSTFAQPNESVNVGGTGCFNVASGYMAPAPNQATHSKCDYVNATSNTEVFALTVFYETLSGYQWTNKGLWLQSNVSLCLWGGIECDENCRVRSLNIQKNNLVGVIPIEISQLEYLRFVYLLCNSIMGDVSSFEKSTKLEKLNLNYNVINEKLPKVPKSLTMLSLQNNYIHGNIPSTYSELENLELILLSNNYLSGELPIFNSKVLIMIDLSFNNLSGNIPLNYIELNSLEYLYLNNNKLNGSVYPVIKVKNTVDLSNNQLDGQLPNLILSLVINLNISSNYLQGSLSGVSSYNYLIDARNNPNASHQIDSSGLIPTDSYIILNDLLCPYLKHAVWNHPIIMVDPSYYDYMYCESVVCE
jgi:hypothetical protein